MAGLLYLPRLFVYHCAWPAGSETSEQLKTMERRLLRLIMNPAMAATYVFGAALAFTPGIIDWSAGWFHVKRSEEHTSELQSLMRISYAVFCLKKKKQ